MPRPELEFTGERFTPECLREMRYEHWHRYAFAAALAPGRRVLDAACGEGYGSALLAGAGAASVLGADIDPATVAHARLRYGELPGLEFVEADATRLDSLSDGGFDLVVSFETLEHVEAQERLLDGFARLLAPGGVLLVSSPDKRTYSDQRGHHNPFHVRELYRDQFEALLAARFPARRLWGQKLLFQSALWQLDEAGASWSAQTLAEGDRKLEPGLAYEPLYFLAACASEQATLDALPALSLFGDAGETVYAHYDHEVRKNMAAGERIQQLEAEIDQLRAQLEARRTDAGR